MCFDIHFVALFDVSSPPPIFSCLFIGLWFLTFLLFCFASLAFFPFKVKWIHKYFGQIKNIRARLIQVQSFGETKKLDVLICGLFTVINNKQKRVQIGF
jgi:hypothetical protein